MRISFIIGLVLGKMVSWPSKKLNSPNSQILFFNILAAITLSEISVIHTLNIVGKAGLIEANLFMSLIMNLNPVIAVLFTPALIISISWVGWKISDQTGLAISSFWVGFTAFDCWTHLFLASQGVL